MAITPQSVTIVNMKPLILGPAIKPRVPPQFLPSWQVPFEGICSLFGLQT